MSMLMDLKWGTMVVIVVWFLPMCDKYCSKETQIAQIVGLETFHLVECADSNFSHVFRKVSDAAHVAGQKTFDAVSTRLAKYWEYTL